MGAQARLPRWARAFPAAEAHASISGAGSQKPGHVEGERLAVQSTAGHQPGTAWWLQAGPSPTVWLSPPDEIGSLLTSY